jgi:hypothetical protein
VKYDVTLHRAVAKGPDYMSNSKQVLWKEELSSGCIVAESREGCGVGGHANASDYGQDLEPSVR